VEGRLRGCRVPWAYPPRFPPHGRTEPRQSRRAREDGDAAHRAPDALGFDRYNIVSESDLVTAASRLDAFFSQQGQKRDIETTPTVTQIESRRKA
jgi:hypothetical protein